MLVQQSQSKRENNKIINALKTIGYNYFYTIHSRGAVLAVSDMQLINLPDYPQLSACDKIVI